MNPNYAQAYYNLGTVFIDLGQIKKAQLYTKKAIELNPCYSEAYYNLGNILKDLGKSKEAEKAYKIAIKLKPNFVEVYNNLASMLKNIGKLKEAKRLTKKAIEINPNYANAYFNLGSILIDLNDLEGAEVFTKKAIEINPNLGIAYSNLGGILKDLDKLKEAEFYTKKAIEINPNLAEPYSNMGNILEDYGEIYDAIIFYKNALKINNKLSIVKSALIKSKGSICDWSDQETQKIWIEKLGIEGSSVHPLGLFYYEDDPLKQLKRAQNLYKEKYRKKSKIIANFNNNKFNIGYFSSDFRRHPTMHLISSILKLHDKSKFNIFLYSFVPEEDEYTEIAKQSGCIFRDIRNLNDHEAIKLARNDKLDIAIDLMGYIKYNRMNILANRVAPIQINYLGYPGTLGNENIDYIIADKVIIPKGYEKFYSEKIIRMPSCYQCNDNTKEICKESISRKDFKLPEKGFIFTCFNANKKITPNEFDIWMRLLKEIKGSVLWLYQSNKYSVKNLIKEAETRNVNSNRLIFANSLPLGKHLARHTIGDLALDTFNYNGHTTTSDALWAGLPVLTKIGESFAARVSASILTSIDLPELITHNEKEYEEKALEIARSPEKLKSLKSKLARARETSALFNSELFTKDLENKFIELAS